MGSNKIKIADPAAEERMESSNVHKVALLVSIACVLQIAESAIPHPIPGLRLGLANVITLITMVMMGFRAAMEVTILRTILGALVMGTFMSPTFLLSFGSGVVSVAVMGACLGTRRPVRRHGLSIVGISILGALAHNVTQLYLAYLLLVQHPGILMFLPWLCLGAVMTGWLTGIVAGRVCLNLEDYRSLLKEPRGDIGLGREVLQFSHYVEGRSPVHRLAPEWKIAGIFLLSLGVLVINNFWFYAGLGILLALVAGQSRTPFVFLFSTVSRCAFMVAVSFWFPLFFDSGSHVLLDIALVRITVEGLTAGAFFACRIVLLILFSALLVRTTSPAQLAQALARLLAPLKLLGISGERVAKIFSLSWMAIPVFWDIANEIVRKLDMGRARGWSRLIHLASDFITRFYLEAEGAFALIRIEAGLKVAR